MSWRPYLAVKVKEISRQIWNRRAVLTSDLVTVYIETPKVFTDY